MTGVSYSDNYSFDSRVVAQPRRPHEGYERGGRTALLRCFAIRRWSSFLHQAGEHEL